MRVITINLNGIRSASRKGFFEWLKLQDADFVCVQELKAQEINMTDEMVKTDNLQGYFSERFFYGKIIIKNNSLFGDKEGLLKIYLNT